MRREKSGRSAFSGVLKKAHLRTEPCYNIGVMKTIAIHLRLATASHRKRMMGIFRFFGSADSWELRILPDEEHLSASLQSSDPSDIPDGIISGVPYTDEARKLIAESGIPFVGIGMTAGGIGLPLKKAAFVANDNNGIGKAAADFFLNLGNFRSFAFIPDELERDWSAQREKAFAGTLAAHGKSCSVFTGEKKGNRGEKALASFLDGLEKPAAVFAAWDGRAADALHAARIADLRVPEEISVLGVDDDELICEHTRPALSSIRTDAEGMGETAAKLLAETIKKGKTAVRKPVTRPILGIIERDSTRTPAPAAQLIRRANAYIEAEAHNGIHPDDVARALNVSRRLLDLRFREYEHTSLSEKITCRKIETAKRLLTESSSAVKDVFRGAGFASVTNANKLFKAATGMTPAAWRLRRAKPAEESENGRRLPFQPLAGISESDGRDLAALTALLDPQTVFDADAVRSAILCGNAEVFVKRSRGRIVAAATIARFSTPTGTHHRIEDVIVHPDLRGKGIGRKMMLHLLDHLRSRQAKSVELTSRPSRVAANALYRSLGFRQRTTNVYEFRFG